MYDEDGAVFRAATRAFCFFLIAQTVALSRTTAVRRRLYTERRVAIRSAACKGLPHSVQSHVFIDFPSHMTGTPGPRRAITTLFRRVHTPYTVRVVYRAITLLLLYYCHYRRRRRSRRSYGIEWKISDRRIIPTSVSVTRCNTVVYVLHVRV